MPRATGRLARNVPAQNGWRPGLSLWRRRNFGRWRRCRRDFLGEIRPGLGRDFGWEIRSGIGRWLWRIVGPGSRWLIRGRIGSRLRRLARWEIGPRTRRLVGWEIRPGWRVQRRLGRGFRRYGIGKHERQTPAQAGWFNLLPQNRGVTSSIRSFLLRCRKVVLAKDEITARGCGKSAQTRPNPGFSRPLH